MRPKTLLSIFVACSMLAAPAAAHTLLTAGPTRYQITIYPGYPTINGSLGWRGVGDLKVAVGYNRGALTLRCTGHGIAHLRILARGRLLTRVTCTGQDVRSRNILRQPPSVVAVVGWIYDVGTR